MIDLKRSEFLETIGLIENGAVRLKNYKTLFSKQIKSVKTSNGEILEMIKVVNSDNIVRFIMPTDKIINKNTKYESYLCLIKGLKSYSDDKEFVVKEIKIKK